MPVLPFLMPLSRLRDAARATATGRPDSRFAFPASVGIRLGTRCGLVGLLFGAAMPAGAHAQTMTDEALANKVAAWRKTMVQVRGATAVTIDPKTQTATIHLYNPQSDTAVVTVTLRFTEAQPLAMPTAEALLTDDSVKEDSVRRAQATSDSLEKLWSLADWVQEPLPVQLWLAPHQTVQLTLHLKVPAALKPGTYSAYLVVSTVDKIDVTQVANVLAAAMDQVMTGASGGTSFKHGWMFMPAPFMPSATVKLVYTTGASIN